MAGVHHHQARFIFALNAANPVKYRDNPRVEVTGRDGGPIESVVGVAIAEFSDAEPESIVRQGIERCELAIEGQLLDAAGPAIDALEANCDGSCDDS